MREIVFLWATKFLLLDLMYCNEPIFKGYGIIFMINILFLVYTVIKLFKILNVWDEIFL